MKMPKMKKASIRKVSPGRIATGHVAFPGGGDKAFKPPSTAITPDTAFTGAMAQPQNAGSSIGASSALPMPQTPPGA